MSIFTRPRRGGTPPPSADLQVQRRGLDQRRRRLVRQERNGPRQHTLCQRHVPAPAQTATSQYYASTSRRWSTATSPAARTPASSSRPASKNDNLHRLLRPERHQHRHPPQVGNDRRHRPPTTGLDSVQVMNHPSKTSRPFSAFKPDSTVAGKAPPRRRALAASSCGRLMPGRNSPGALPVARRRITSRPPPAPATATPARRPRHALRSPTPPPRSSPATTVMIKAATTATNISPERQKRHGSSDHVPRLRRLAGAGVRDNPREATAEATPNTGASISTKATTSR